MSTQRQDDTDEGVVPDETENFPSSLKPASSDVIPMIQMGKSSLFSSSGLKRQSSDNNVTAAVVVASESVLDLERHESN